MLDYINTAILAIADPLLAWLLYFPHDVALIMVALLTGLVLSGVRVFTTDQSLLKSCKEDKQRLKQLKKEAKSRGDKEAVRRYRQTTGQIGVKTLLAEMKPLLVSLLPIAILAVWAFSRIAYVPPQANDEITVSMYFPLSAVGDYVHMLPVDGVEVNGAWIQRVEDDVLPAVAGETGDQQSTVTVLNGVARWNLHCKEQSEPYKLIIRHGDRNIEKGLIVNGMYYTEPIQAYGELIEEVIEVSAEEYKLFGIVPGIPSIMLAPWMLAYLIIVLPLAFILKPLLRVY